MQDNPILIGFTAGELSPWLSTRIDLPQIRRGASELVNFMVEPYGGLKRRTGSRYIKTLGSNSECYRLFPFCFSSQDNIMMVFSPKSIRFFKNWAELDVTLSGIDLPWETPQQLNQMRLVQVNDIIYVTCPSTPPIAIKRFSDREWRCEYISFKPYPRLSYVLQDVELRAELIVDDDANAGDESYYWLYMPEGSEPFTAEMAGRERLIVDVSIPTRDYHTNEYYKPSNTRIDKLSESTIKEGMVFRQWRKRMVEFLDYFTCIKDWSPSDFNGSERAEDYALHFRMGCFMPFDDKPYDVSGEWSLTTLGTWDRGWELLRSYDDESVDANYLKWDWTTVHTFEQSEFMDRKNWSFSGVEKEPCRLMLSAMYSRDSEFYSHMTIKLIQSYFTATFLIESVLNGNMAKARLLHKDGVLPLSFSSRKWSWGAFGARGGYPSFAGFHEGRFWLGGAASQPTTLYASVVDDYYNFRVGSDADMAMQLTLASDNQSQICWLSTTRGMLFGTSEGEWTLESRDGTGLSPSNVAFRQQSSVGSENLGSNSVENSIFYVQRGGKRLREISYKLESDGYSSTDTSLLAEHLFKSGIKKWAVQRGSSTRVWVLMNDNTVAVLVTDNVQKVSAWQRVAMSDSAIITDIACLPSSFQHDDEVWLTVKRHGDEHCLECITGEEVYLDSFQFFDSATRGELYYMNRFGSDTRYYQTNEYGGSYGRLTVDEPVEETEDDNNNVGSWPNFTNPFEGPADEVILNGQYYIGTTYESVFTTMPMESERSFNAVAQMGRVKLRLLDSTPNFYFKAAHVDAYEKYEPERDLLSIRGESFSGAIRISQLPVPGVGEGFSLKCDEAHSFNLLALSVEIDFHGK